MHVLRGAAGVAGLALVAALGVTPVAPAHAQAPAVSGPPPAASAAAPDAPPSPLGQRIYDSVRPRLVQVRTLLAAQDSQASVGSGFLVSADGLLVTNYHVVSDYALAPARHRLVFATTDGRQGALQLLAVDVVNDLALLRPAQAGALGGREPMPLRGPDEPLARGTRLFALGNPLDVGFAMTEGTYNGVVERSFVPTLFFGGSLSAGMSGGPTVDDRGRVIGVNVATRRDGEQVSFLVPVAAARALIDRGRAAAPITTPVWPQVAAQLDAHQAALTDRFVALPWRGAGHARYRIPVPREDFMRCWGQGSPQATRGLQFERSDCVMDSRVFVGDGLDIGHFSVRHETYDGQRIGALRFAQRHSASFENERFGADTPQLTAPRCHEDTVDRDGLPLRSVLCLRAYKKLPGLYTMSLLVATLDAPRQGAQGRFDADGVSWDNAMRLARHYLQGFGWTRTTPPAP
jgi:serine protease Do